MLFKEGWGEVTKRWEGERDRLDSDGVRERVCVCFSDDVRSVLRAKMSIIK